MFDLSFYSRTLLSAGRDLKDPLLIALAQREEANRSGKMVVCTNVLLLLFAMWFGWLAN